MKSKQSVTKRDGEAFEVTAIKCTNGWFAVLNPKVKQLFPFHLSNAVNFKGKLRSGTRVLVKAVGFGREVLILKVLSGLQSRRNQTVAAAS